MTLRHAHGPLFTAIRHRDSGLGLAEVVVGMMVLTIVTLCTVPVLVQGSKQSSDNVTLTAASQYADQQLDRAQSSESKCSVVSALAGAATQRDSRAVTLTRTTTVSSPTASVTCPTAASAYPTTVIVSIAVTRSDTGARVATASTEVYVDVP